MNNELFAASPIVLPLIMLAAVPIVLTILNVIQLCRRENKRLPLFFTELVGIVIGAGYYYTALGNFAPFRWVTLDVRIYDFEYYPPLDPSLLWVVFVIAAVGFAGWLYLRLCPVGKQPPLLTVFAFVSLYVVMAAIILTEIQTCGAPEGTGLAPSWLIALIYPANLTVIIAKLIKEQIEGRKDMPVSEGMSRAAKLLDRSAALPVFAFILFALFIGIVLVLLVLFGQSPDEIIRLWTNTADWNLSQGVPPPKMPASDGHYLCTVAANGHEKLVKPLRTGRRNGHTVLVNRQLQIANAFEDLIHERTPGFHRIVRGFYDRTGLPISRYISTPIRSDVVYILMKPLEWVFLAVLYLCDPKPENRIAVQYMGQRTK